MKKFIQKKKNVIKEDVVNKASNLKKATIIRINDTQAIQAEPNVIKQIQKVLLKNPDASLDNVIKAIGGDTGENFKIVEVERPSRVFSKVTLVDAKTLRISDTQVIKGPSFLIKKVYDYLKENPTKVSNPQFLIQKFDEPVDVNVSTFIEKNNDVSVFADVPDDDEDFEKPSAASKETIPRLMLIDESIKDEDIIDTEYIDFVNSINLRHKYDALGLLLEATTFKNVVDAARIKREYIAKEIDVDFPRETVQPGFVNYDKRKPAFSTKFNPFEDTITVTYEGKTSKRAPAEKLQSRLGSKKTSITARLFNVDDLVSFELRDYMRSDVYDRIRKVEIVQDVQEQEIKGVKTEIPLSYKQFFLREYNKLVKENPEKLSEDAIGMSKLKRFNDLKEIYVREQEPEFKDAKTESTDRLGVIKRGIRDKFKTSQGFRTNKRFIMDEMVNIVVSEFKELYPSTYAMLPFIYGSANFSSFMKTLGTGNRITSFEVNFKKHLQKNLDKLISKDDSERLIMDYNGGNFQIYGLDLPIRNELAIFISNNLDANYEEFFVYKKVLMITQEQATTIKQAYNDYKATRFPDWVEGEVVEKADTIDVYLQQATEFESLVYENLDEKTIFEYIYAMSKYLQIWNTDTKTIGPYAVSIKRRIDEGMNIKDLYDMDEKLIYPDFYLNEELDEKGFKEFLEMSRWITANEILNNWSYAKTYKHANNVWYSKPASTNFKPSKFIVSTLCGKPQDVVYVLEKGKVVCKNTSAVVENIESYTKNNATDIKEILQVPLSNKKSDKDDEEGNADDKKPVKKATVKKIVKKFSLSKMEADVLQNYIEYMNDESRQPFLEKVMVSDRSYLDQFLDMSMENVGNEIFDEEIDYTTSRKQHKDLYNVVKNNDSTGRMLIYKGVLRKLSKLTKEQRTEIYEKYFDTEIDQENLEMSRIRVYEGFSGYLGSLTQKKLEKFIDDVFDKDVELKF